MTITCADCRHRGMKFDHVWIFGSAEVNEFDASTCQKYPTPVNVTLNHRCSQFEPMKEEVIADSKPSIMDEYIRVFNLGQQLKPCLNSGN